MEMLDLAKAMARSASPLSARKLRSEYAATVNMPECLQRHGFAGGQDATKADEAIRYALLLDKFQDMFTFFPDLQPGDSVVFGKKERSRAEIPLLRAMGFPVKLDESNAWGETPLTLALGVASNNFLCQSVTAQDLGVMLYLLGAEGRAGSYRLHGVRFVIDEEGVTVNSVNHVRGMVVSYGMDAVRLSVHASCYLAVMCALAMVHMVEGANIQTKFRRALLDRCVDFFTKETRNGVADGPCQASEEAKVGLVGLQVSLRGPIVPEKTEDVKTLYGRASAAIALLAHPQGKSFYDFNSLCETEAIGGVLHAYVASTDPAKYLKRLLLSSGRQVRLAAGFDKGSVSYKGRSDLGRLARLTVGPSLLPLFAGGPGALLALRGRDPFRDSLRLRLEFKLSGTCYGIKSEQDRAALEASLPRVGDHLEPVLDLFGAAAAVQVDPRLIGGRVVKVTKVTVDDFGNAFWAFTVEVEEEGGEAKLRGSVKGMLGYMSHNPGPETLRSRGLSISVELKGCVLVTADGTKAFGKGNAAFKVKMAVETIIDALGREQANALFAEMLPNSFDEKTGLVRFSEKLDYRGEYQRLIAYMVENFSRVVTFQRAIPEHQWVKLKADYLPEAELGDGEAVWTAPKANALGHVDTVRFFRNGDMFVVSQTTAVLEVVDIVKVESSAVSQAVSTGPSMLEVATWFAAIGLKQTARMLYRGNIGGVKSVLGGLRDLVFGDTPGDPEKPELDAWDPANAEAMSRLAETPIPEWEPGTRVRLRTRWGTHFYASREALLGAAETEAAHTLATTLAILAFYGAGETERAASLTNSLHASFCTIVDSPEFMKRLARGARAVSAKRVPIITRRRGSHRLVYLNPAGRPAEELLKQFRVDTVRDLEGKMVIGYRAPMPFGAPLTIVLADWVPMSVIGITDETSSFDEGDFDGDGYNLVAVTCPRALKELKGFDARAWKDRIYQACIGDRKALAEHWVEQNRWSFKDWPVSALRPVEGPGGMVQLCEAALGHQVIEMPTDANRADIALALAAIPGAGYVDPLLAAGLKMYVYETQLAGFSAAWSKAHTLKGEEFISYAVETLGLTPALASAWQEVSLAQEAVQAYEVQNAIAEGRPISRRAGRDSEDGMTAYRFAFTLVAVAAKKLSQGEQTIEDGHKLLPMLKRAKIKVVHADRVEIISVWDRVTYLVKKGIPAAKLLDVSIHRVQPLVDELRKRKKKRDND